MIEIGIKVSRNELDKFLKWFEENYYNENIKYCKLIEKLFNKYIVYDKIKEVE